MKIVFTLLLSLSLFVSTALAHTPSGEEIRQQFIEANEMVIAISMCNISYADRVENGLINLLENHNFDIEKHSIKNTVVDSQMIITRYDNQFSGKLLYIVTFRGSNNKKDWKLYFKYGKVPYDNSIKLTPEQPLPTDIPLVHNGFNEYTNIALALKDSNEALLTDTLLNDKNAQILVTGHSLGGSLATLYAARLLDLGIEPERLQVITFGAPSVGNKIFAEKYQDKLNLTRVVISQDLAPGALRAVGGYTQFGKEVKFAGDPRKHDYLDQHSPSLYFHEVIKYYFDTEDKAIAAGVAQADPTQKIVPGKPLVAVYSSATNEAKKVSDFKYMPRVISDELCALLPSYITIPSDDYTTSGMDFTLLPKLIKRAKQEHAKFLLINQLDVDRAKDSGKDSIILNYLVIDVNTEHTIAAASISSSFKVRTGSLQTLLFDLSHLPFDMFR